MNPPDASWVVRLAAQAGRFYPAEPARLGSDVDGYVRAAQGLAGPAPKAIVAPHAGYEFSGPIAGSAYARLAQGREQFRRVVLLGPSHYEQFTGLAAPEADGFATPLGTVAVDRAAVDRVSRLSEVRVSERAHRPEHCLEVQLPFLQRVLDDFAIVPLLVGEASAEEVGNALALLWGSRETCVVVSSDLSHYRDHAAARALDRTTATRIESLEGDRLDSQCACGWQPIRGLLRLARQKNLRCRTVDLRNSGDTAGPRDRVVGYGAFVFEEVAGT
ncbi:MAG: AmmeMemoRadiSam system protein B [Verrucomicrobia bacterium]|nr:AmmeMemoRadiSam system protein B [Verrucomicrobiota bacterium]